jgi:predicted nicotinamide N-methyase
MLNSINFQANALDSISEARSFGEKVLSYKKENAWKIEIKGEIIVLRDIVMKLLGWMDRFKEIGDIIIQFDPMYAALPWAGFQLLLKVD